MSWNFTNVTNADLIGGLGQSLAPITSTVIGIPDGFNFILGFIILIGLWALLASRGAGFEMIVLVTFFAVWGLTSVALLPQSVFWVMLIISAAIVALALIKSMRK